MGVNPRFDGTANVSLYNVMDPSNNNDFVTEFETPGFARAVSIYNGIGYVADHAAGLQVVNYLAFDNMGIAPSITISTQLEAIAEEGKRFRVTADVQDDSQVRNVEFYINGERVATDGNFPFEVRLVAPQIENRASFTLQARASDTGGNASFSETLEFQLVPDATPPQIVRNFPQSGATLGSVRQVSASFSEPMNVNSINEGTFRLLFAGSDGVLGSGDDVIVPTERMEFLEGSNTALLAFDENLRPGLYRAIVSRNVTDLAGLILVREGRWDFRVFSADDMDNDGVPDELEVVLGLDPLNRDTDGDGIVDGLEDFDEDNLPNVGEVILESNPQVADSNSNGILDGDEDMDGDLLSDGREIALRTNARAADSDFDGWPDNDEVEYGGDPLDPRIAPPLLYVAYPPVAAVVPGFGEGSGVTLGITVAQPPVAVVLPGFGEAAGIQYGLTIATPPVAAVVPGFGAEAGVKFGLTIAQPPVAAVLPGFGEEAGVLYGPTFAQPPVAVVLPNFNQESEFNLGLTIGKPPVRVRLDSQ